MKPDGSHYYTQSFDKGNKIGFHAKKRAKVVSSHLVVMENKWVFKKLKANRELFESNIDGNIFFDADKYSHDVGRVSVKYQNFNIFSNEEMWDKYQNWLRDRGDEFYDVSGEISKEY